MKFNTTAVVSAMALLMAGQAFGVAIDTTTDEVDSVLIAPDPNSACNCPNNCNHHAGSSCKFCEYPNASCKTVSGVCQEQDGSLTCIQS